MRMFIERLLESFNNRNGRFLYKGLREEEINSKQLIPKEQGTFAQSPKLPISLPFSLDITPENAAINHQKEEGNGAYLTSGVSTTTELDIALKYATNNGEKDGVVAYIFRDKLRKYNIKEFDTKKCKDVQKPEDCEVIIYDNIGYPLTKKIIKKYKRVRKEEFLG